MLVIDIPLHVVLAVLLVMGLIAVTLIAAGGLLASIPSVIIALVARRFGAAGWLQARAIGQMSPAEVIIAVAAASTISALVGGTVGYQMGSIIAFFVVTWLIAVPLSAIILFSDPQRRR